MCVESVAYSYQDLKQKLFLYATYKSLKFSEWIGRRFNSHRENPQLSGLKNLNVFWMFVSAHLLFLWFCSIFNLCDKTALLNTDEIKHSSVPGNSFLGSFWEPSLSDTWHFGYSFRQFGLMDYVLLLFEGCGERR